MEKNDRSQPVDILDILTKIPCILVGFGLDQ